MIFLIWSFLFRFVSYYYFFLLLFFTCACHFVSIYFKYLVIFFFFSFCSCFCVSRLLFYFFFLSAWFDHQFVRKFCVCVVVAVHSFRFNFFSVLILSFSLSVLLFFCSLLNISNPLYVLVFFLLKKKIVVRKIISKMCNGDDHLADVADSVAMSPSMLLYTYNFMFFSSSSMLLSIRFIRFVRTTVFYDSNRFYNYYYFSGIVYWLSLVFGSRYLLWSSLTFFEWCLIVVLIRIAHLQQHVFLCSSFLCSIFYFVLQFLSFMFFSNGHNLAKWFSDIL